ncbi:unnamed protein product [Symbiodinium sp. KB8]|nr:unnamed protein product [Symbiodinium sp. KB8]
MPLVRETDEMGGYRKLIESTFSELLEGCTEEGVLAVVYDKNPMEATGYAATIAELTGEKVFAVEYYVSDPEPPVRWTDDKYMEIRIPSGEWARVRAAFRYVTQRPWTRFPISSKTLVLNPVSVLSRTPLCHGVIFPPRSSLALLVDAIRWWQVKHTASTMPTSWARDLQFVLLKPSTMFQKQRSHCG